jgi:hypothetical protein
MIVRKGNVIVAGRILQYGGDSLVSSAFTSSQLKSSLKAVLPIVVFIGTSMAKQGWFVSVVQ